MKILRSVMAVGISAVFLSACAGMQLEKAEQSATPDSSFEQGLHSGYIALAQGEAREGDYKDSDNFANRAIATSMGDRVSPEMIDSRKLPSDKVTMLSSSRERLVAALDQGGAEKSPEAAARAQVMFDCWMQEQEENFQPNDIESCRNNFYTALKQVEDAVRPVAAAAPAPAPKPMEAQTFVVYFEHDKADLNAAAMAVLAEAEVAAEKMKGARIVVSGNTDRVGSTAYNQKLSEMRARAVADFLAGSVDAKSIESMGFGYSRPAVEAAPNVRAPLNRRVEITIEP